MERRLPDSSRLIHTRRKMNNEPIHATSLDVGWAALKNGNWEGARTAFEESLAAGETPETLEGMGWVGHMLSEARLTFAARERAYRLYFERGDKSSAARIAAYLASAKH